MKTGPISVLLVSNAVVRGGAEEHILQLLGGLDRKLFRLHLACPPELARLYGSDVPSDVVVTTLNLDRLSDVSGAWKLARFIRRHKIDLMHSHMFRASLFASPVGWLCRVPVIIDTSHGRELWRKGWKANFFVDRCAARFVDHTIAVSAATRRYLVEQKELPAEKISVICSAVDVHRFSPDHPAPQGLKQSLGFDANDPVLVVAGRLEPQKGHRVLIDAMPAVLEEFPRAKLVCLSEGSLRPELERRIAQLNLQRSVFLVGQQRDVRDWLAMADINVLPSFYEGLPLAAIEALAMAKPMVATAVDGTPEVVRDGETGQLAPAGDPAKLAEAIRDMLRNPARAQEMAQAGRRFVVENFSIETLVRRTQELYLDQWERYQRRTHGAHVAAKSQAASATNK
ncbi:MAG: glycosyltransferase family 4 protein [Terriglobales bacterium]